MKPRLLLSLSLTLSLFASAASAAEVELSAGICPGSAGSSSSAYIDCANGNVTELVVTFRPVEDMADFIGFDAVIVANLSGDTWDTNATFWDFSSGGANAGGMSAGFAPSGSPCTGWIRVISGVGSSVSANAVNFSPGQVRIEASGTRATPTMVYGNQKLLGMVVRIDSNPMVSQHLPLSGCGDLVCVDLDHVTPRRAGSTPATTIFSESNFPPSRVVFNDFVGEGGCLGGLPARRSTWGDLKQLYR